MTKEELKAYQRDYYQKNKEKRREYQREWNRTHPEKAAEYKRDYRAKNPEKLRESKRRWFEENREQVNQRMRDRTLNMTDEDRARQAEAARQWREENREHSREYMREYMREYHKKRGRTKVDGKQVWTPKTPVINDGMNTYNPFDENNTQTDNTGGMYATVVKMDEPVRTPGWGAAVGGIPAGGFIGDIGCVGAQKEFRDNIVTDPFIEYANAPDASPTFKKFVAKKKPGRKPKTKSVVSIEPGKGMPKSVVVVGERVWCPKDVAKFVGQSPSQIYRLIKQGRIEAFTPAHLRFNEKPRMFLREAAVLKYLGR